MPPISVWKPPPVAVAPAPVQPVPVVLPSISESAPEHLEPEQANFKIEAETATSTSSQQVEGVSSSFNTFTSSFSNAPTAEEFDMIGPPPESCE